MIDALIIDDLGVIEHAELELADGLNVLTGETGAGKTMIVTALGLIRGERSETRLIRTGADAARVQGVWDEGAGGGDGIDSDGLIVQRTVSANGKSRAQVNGSVVPAAKLRELCEDLITVHGQSEQLTLKQASAQLAMLDEAGGLTESRTTYQRAYHAWRDVDNEFEDLKATADARSAEAATLREQVQLVEDLQLQPGEVRTLQQAIERQSNMATITEELQRAHALVAGDDTGEHGASATVQLNDAVRALETTAAFDASLQPLYDRLRGLTYELDDTAQEIASALEDTGEGAVESLAAAQTRLGEIQRVERLLGASSDGLLEFLASGSDRLLELDTASSRLDTMADAVRKAENTATALADELHASRVQAAAQISDAVTAELRALAMGSAEFTIEVVAGDALQEDGWDSAHFMMRANSGSAPQPIAKAASGGELSRIMLAVELVMARQMSNVTYVFDEVDAGVGGASAIEIGRRLAELGKHHQVLVVTHLAQVAAFADHHIVVEKVDTGAVTTSDVHAVADDERVAELARMLAGSDSTVALAHAQELINRANHTI